MMKSEVALVAVCHHKRALLKECTAALATYGKDLRECNAAVEAAKSRAEESREKCKTAFKRYFDHREEHGC
jgi:hypothetical protein